MAHTTRARIFKAATVAGLIFSAFSAWANSLEAVNVSQGANDSQVLKITLSDALTTMPMYFTTANPHRIVLDFPNTDDAMGRRAETLDTGVVHGYNVVHSGDRTRVVVDLNGPATYDLRKDKNILLVALKGTQVAPGTTEPAHFASTGNASFDIRDVSFHRGDNNAGRIEVNLSDPGVGIDIKQKGSAIQVDFLNTTLPQALQRKLDVSEFATPTQTIETFAHGKSTRMIVTPKGQWDYVAYQTGKKFILEVNPLNNANGLPEQKKYTGEKLSLDFQNVDVRSVLKVIADFTGVNIVAADSVQGNVTIRLKDVPWDQALDIILRAKGLGKRVNGNVIWVEQADVLAKKEEEEKKAQISIEQLEPLVTKNYKLNYVRADDAMAIVAGLSRTNNTGMTAPTCSPSSEGLVNLNQQANSSSPGSSTNNPQFNSANSNSGNQASNRVLSSRGAATYDLTTNTLIVTDIPDRQAKVAEILKSIDIPSKQVMIEARIVIADDSFGRELGARLGIQRWSSGGSGTGISGTGATSYSAATSTTSTSPTYNVNLPASNPLGGTASVAALGYTLIDAANNRLLSLELSALESDQRGKVISNPKVITTNLKPAVILQGTQIPYQTSSANAGTNTQFKDAVLCLLVAPQVLNNDDIILDVEVQKDQPNTSYSPPAIDVKRVETQVRVKNGETAVLGGIFEQTQTNNTDKVPLLGDIPVLGALFRNNSKTDQKTEMLIFLTPRVLQ